MSSRTSAQAREAEDLDVSPEGVHTHYDRRASPTLVNFVPDDSPPPTSNRARSPLLQAKLTAPQPAPFQVTRAALRERICRLDGEKVVLIQAPAGFGKTTVMLQVMSLLEARGVPISWLTIDAADNDVGRFLGFLGAALDRLVSPADAAHAEEANAEAAGVAALDLIDRVACARPPFALFLDDVEALQNPAALALVRQLIEHLPPGGRLVLGSRMAPDIGVARLLAHGQLLELDPVALRFTMNETQDFLQSKRGLTLADADVARLQQVTEGWPVALWLASLALERGASADLAPQLSGSHAAVADYLAEEVLAQQPPELRDFMLRTSVLQQLSAPLCDAVRGSSDSAELLGRLARSNLFVQPVSEARDWFRYHSLFAGFLRTHLERTRPREVGPLHRAAAAWYEAQQRPIPAIEHALASGDAAYAMPLLERHAEQLLEEGRVRLVARLLDSAAREDLVQWPRLRLIHAWAMSFTRGGQDALKVLEGIEASGALPAPLAAHALALRPMLLTMLDRFDEAYAAAQAANDHVSPAQAFPFSLLRTAHANLLLVMGKYAAARELLDASRAQQIGPEGPFMMTFAQCVDGAIDLLHGRLRQATSRFRHSAAAGSRKAFMNTNGNAMAGILLAEALYEQDELDESERLLNVYVPLMRELGLCDHLVCGHRNLVRIAFHRGDPDRALHAATEMECVGHRMGLGRLIASAQLERARLALWSNDARAAREALQRARSATDWTHVMNRSLFGNDADTIVESQLRYTIHHGDPAEAVAPLKLELERAESAKRHRRALRLRILLALALDGGGGEKAALRTVRDALRFGAEERFVRMFLDEGERFQQLLRKASGAERPDAPTDELSQYFERLSGARKADRTEAPATGAAETLTRKELEILKLLAEGLSNQAIANRLFVSETTVRTHLRNINAKLQAHNRTQAIAVARKLKLLE